MQSLKYFEWLPLNISGCINLHNVMLKNTMKFIVLIIDDINHTEFNNIHWEGCLYITRRYYKGSTRNFNPGSIRTPFCVPV